MTHPDVQKMADAAESLVCQWFLKRSGPGKRWRVVAGGVGTGKSRVSRAIARYCRSAAWEAWGRHWGGGATPGVLSVEWLTVASPEKCDDREFERFIGDCEAATIIVLDDIGTETDQFKTKVPVQRLCHLMNRIEGKYAWITTNKDQSVWETTWDDRVSDRLLAGDLVEVMAPSYRSQV